MTRVCIEVLAAAARRRVQEDLYQVCARRERCQVQQPPPVVARGVRVSSRSDQRANELAVRPHHRQLQRCVRCSRGAFERCAGLEE